MILLRIGVRILDSTESRRTFLPQLVSFAPQEQASTDRRSPEADESLTSQEATISINHQSRDRRGSINAERARG